MRAHTIVRITILKEKLSKVSLAFLICPSSNVKKLLKFYLPVKLEK